MAEKQNERSRKTFLTGKTKVIIFAVLGYVIFLIIGIILTSYEWLSVLQLLFYFILTPFLILGVILLVYWYLVIYRKEQQTKSDTFNQEPKLNADTMEEWIKNYMKKKRHDNVLIQEHQYIKIGKEGKITPILCVKLYGKTSYRSYYFFINLVKPTEENSLIEENYLSEDEIEKYATKMAEVRRETRKEVIRVRSDDGITRQVERELPNEIEDISKEE